MWQIQNFATIKLSVSKKNRQYLPINQINIFGDDIDEMTEASFPRFGKGLDQITAKSNELADALAMDSEEIKNFSNISQEEIKKIVDQGDELNEALAMDLE